MSLATREFLGARVSRVREFLTEQDLDALIVTHLPNVFYLTNFSGSAAIVVLTRRDVRFITDFRYVSAVESLLAEETSCQDTTLVPVDRTYDETLASVVRGLGAVRVGFEAAHLSVKRHEWLRSAIGDTEGLSLVATDGVNERARRCKDAHEIDTLRTAAHLLSQVVPKALDAVRAGHTERQIAAQVDWLLRQAGFERPAFETIVASGPNSALPHARPENRTLRAGDLVVLDFGGVYDGYCVDLTRMASLGEPDVQVRRLFEAVEQAQAAALGTIRAGVLASAVDAAARDTLKSYDLADAFGHGTGHGLGIEVHEEPRITRQRAQGEPGVTDCVLEPGMVFTVEPGVYLPGSGGVRIEDDILVTREGCEVLTEAPRELVVR